MDIINEANKCLNCIDPSCVKGCPLHNDIPAFIKALKENNIIKAREIIHSTSMIPSICSLLCPIEKQCVGNCIRNKINDPVKINEIENYITKDENLTFPKKKNNYHVAIIGAGPSGLSCAIKLNELNYNVDIYDKYHQSGGILRYGIPSFIFDKKIIDKIENELKDANTNFYFNKEFGKDFYLNDLLNKYDAIYLALGASKVNVMNIDGEDASNLYSSKDFLEKMNSNNFDINSYHNIIVCGGGNSAVDTALAAKINNPEANVSIMYRRSKKEMPCNIKEYNIALNNNISFIFCTNPIRYIKNKENKIIQIETIKMKLEKSNSGKAKPFPIEGSNEIIEADLVIEALGSKVDSSILSNINLSSYGNIMVNSNMQTNIPKVFAGGDLINGTTFVVDANKNGLQAAKSIDKYIKGELENE